MRILCITIVFALLCYVGFCKSESLSEGDYNESEENMQKDDYEDYNDTADDNDKIDVSHPKIVSKPQEFIASLYEQVRLPCVTEDAVDDVLMWYKDSDLLFQDKFALGTFGAFYTVEENKSLLIKNFTEQLAGKYMCVIFTEQDIKPNITHEVYLPTPPKIEYLKADHDIIQLESGKTLILTCKANGHPKPTISWHKDAFRFDTQGETFILENITHKDSGKYRCLADNKVGDPAHSYIDIKITHKPIVNIEKLTVNTAENYDTELICSVHSVPQAVVNWKKDGKNIIPNNERIFLKTVNHSHILIIKQVQPADFGQYNCSAVNYLGESHKIVSLVSTPSILNFNKLKQGKDIILSWKVESHLPVLAHQVQFRKSGVSDWKEDEVKNSVTDNKNLYNVEYIIKGLEPGTYETRLRSKNTNGWSEFSPIHYFDGVPKKHGAHHNKHHKKHHKTHNEAEHNTPVQEEFGNDVSKDDNQKPNLQETSYPAQPKDTSSSTTYLPSVTSFMMSAVVLLFRQL